MHCGYHVHLELQLPAVFPELFILCQAPGLFLGCLLSLNHQNHVIVLYEKAAIAADYESCAAGQAQE